MNILVTGGCGFIGSNFINYYFNKIKGKIVCIDALYYCASLESINQNIRESQQFVMIYQFAEPLDLYRGFYALYKPYPLLKF